MLYIVATPIGNLKDITIRALEVLQSVNGIICEDTRRTSKLLNHFQVKKPLIALNDFNEASIVPKIIERLKSGRNLALVSDAGTPLISDPGYKLVRECLAQNIPIDSLPGPSSVITALTLSSLPPDKFLFLGYLPKKEVQRINLLTKLTLIHGSIRVTYIIFVPPHKMITTLSGMQKVFGDIDVSVAHELTKIHQSVESMKISEWIEKLKSPKGEYVLLFRLSQ